MYVGRKPSSSSSLIVIIGFLIYVAVLVMSIAILPLAMAIILGLLPLTFLFLNQTFDFQPPLSSLHGLFVSAIVLFILWPRYLAFNLGGPDITPSRVAYALLLLLWVVALLSPTFRRDLVTSLREVRGWLWLVVIYVLLRIISCFFSIAPQLSFYLIANELLTAVLILPIAISVYRNRSRLESLAQWLLLAGVVVALLAISEIALGHTLFANISLPGMRVDSEWLEQAVMDKVRGGRYRAQSTFSHPLLLAEFMMFMLPFSMYFIVHRKLIWRFIGAFSLLLFIAGALLTGSRSALVAIPPIILMAVVLLSMRKSDSFVGGALWIVTLMALGLGALISVVMWVSGSIDFSLLTGKSTLEMSSTNARVLMLARGLPLVADHPLVGFGPGLGGYVLGINKASGAITIDNFYLSMALDSGVPAMLAFMALAIGLAGRGYLSSLRNLSDEGLLTGMLSISVTGVLIVKSILSIPHNAPLLYLALALITVVPTLPPREKAPC